LLLRPLLRRTLLTYKSIQAAVKAFIGKSLFVLPSEVGDGETPRVLLISERIRSDFMPPWPDTIEGERRAGARALLDAFSNGDFFTVGQDPHNKDPDAMMARVDPTGDEVFDFRSFDCRQGLRIFGCFIEKDEFIALTWDFREDVDWDNATAECMAEWRRLFGDLLPHSGDSIDDYLSFAESA
jgi:hypothetical protein